MPFPWASASAYTDAVVLYLKAVQTPEGKWNGFQSRRPPMSTGEQQAIAMAIYSFQQDGRPEDKTENEKAIARAAAWLEASKPTGAQDMAYRLMGLAWAQAKPEAVAAAAKQLAATQREDGCWSRFSTMRSDAYARGEALYALYTGKKGRY
jgi:hypothetical protein